MIKDKHHRKNERDRLISEMMQFLLQRNESRFLKQLMAQLLEEGCNYPITLAKPRFYELMVQGLADQLDNGARKEFDKRMTKNFLDLNHLEFIEAMRYFVSHLKNSEKQMALEVINSIEQLIDLWKLNPPFFAAGLDDFNARLRAVVEKYTQASARCRLSTFSINQIRRRIYLALTTSLFRFIKDPKQFQMEFGTIPEVLKAIQEDHSVFCRVMAFFSTQTPFFSHAASQAFWRTLQSLNTEYPAR